MSYKRSVFPEGGYDTFVELYDLPPSYESLVLEFSQLRAKENKTPAEELRYNELTNILQNYIIDTEKWNKFCDAVTGLQKFFLENTQGYIDTLKLDVNNTVTNGKAEINTTKDNALIAIENKKENIINYMDETTAGAIRNDIGVMGDSTIEGRSLIDKTNLLKSDIDAIDDKIGILQGSGEAKEKANKSDLTNLQTEVNEHMAEIVQHLSYAIASGTNTYAVAIEGITSLTEGMSIKVKFTNANTGISTLNINGLGAKGINKGNGNALSSGNIKAGQICHLVYTGSVFQLLGEGGEYGTAIAQDVLVGKTIGTENGVTNGTMPNRGAVTITPSNTDQTISEGYHNGLGKVEGVKIAAGNIAAYTSTVGVTERNSSYIKKREVKVNHGGTVRIKFNLVEPQHTFWVFGRIYKNGVPIGIERMTSSSVSTDYTEDFVCNAGDRFALYMRSPDGVNASNSLFQVLLNSAPVEHIL